MFFAYTPKIKKIKIELTKNEFQSIKYYIIKRYKIQIMENKQDRILNAAFEKFKKYGFLKTTVEEIARQAQVGKGTIYFYFKSKEDILLALVDREMAEGFTKIARAMSDEPEISAKLRKMLEVTVDYFHNNELVSKVMAMDQGFVLSVITKKNKELQQLSISWVKTLLDQGKNEGVFRDIDTEKVAYILDSLIRSFHYLHYLGLEKYKPEDVVGSVFDLISRGIETR